MKSFYGVSYRKISNVFLANVAGYFISYISSAAISQHPGARWALIIAGCGMASGCLILTFAPPFPAFVIGLALFGFGCALYDSVLTTIVSHEEDTASMSYLYAAFGIGAMGSPLLIGGFIDRGISWNYYYYVPLGLTLLLGVVSHLLFAEYEAPSDDSSAPTGSLDPEATEASSQDTSESSHHASPLTRTVLAKFKLVLQQRTLWACLLLIALEFAMMNTVSGWLVSFMVTNRTSPSAVSRYQLSGFWGGVALGRMALAILSKRLGERNASLLVLGGVSACLAVVWSVHDVAVDACAFAAAGFFFGPLAPNILSAVTVGVAPSLKSSVMSLTVGLGLIGSALGPSIFGIVAGKGGLASLPGVLIGTSCISGVAWLFVPTKGRRLD